MIKWKGSVDFFRVKNIEKNIFKVKASLLGRVANLQGCIGR